MAVTVESCAKDERLGPAEVAGTAALVAASPLPRYFDSHPLMTLVLDRSRQIVYANCASIRLAEAGSASELFGLRLGEALGCIHATEGPGGCGTSESCCFCGAARCTRAATARLETFIAGASAGMAALDAAPRAGEECNISRNPESMGGALNETSIDLRVWTETIEVGGRGLVLLAAENISAEKRREVLERVFYHDIANTANGIRTILELLENLDEEPPARYKSLLKSAADQIVEEIESQRALKAAETRDLEARFEILEARNVLESTLAIFSYKLEGKDIRLELAPATPRVAVESDPVILRRVLVNMVKNAIEAAVRGEILQAGINVEQGQGPLDPNGESGGSGWAVFWVRNGAVMPEVARRRVFHRSFSTKGRGRGIGTYSMRLLAEAYLRGRVSFSSREGEGTIFELRVPLA